MSSTALPQPDLGMENTAALLFPLGESQKERITDLDTLLHTLLRTPPLKQAVAMPEDLAVAMVPPPGMFTALRVCMLAHEVVMLAGAISYECWRAAH